MRWKDKQEICFRSLIGCGQEDLLLREQVRVNGFDMGNITSRKGMREGKELDVCVGPMWRCGCTVYPLRV